jgi:hypothetical protein
MGRQFPILVYNSGTKALLEHQKRCSMDLWTFRSCPAPGGGRPIDRFIDDLGPEAENDLSAILEDLQVMERRLWNRPQFDVLHGKNYKGMGEIRFDGENKTYRLFGWFGPQVQLFTFLLGCEKKRNLKHEMDEAAKRKSFAEKNERLLYEFTFETISIRKTR